jgi:hypothetical protein
MLDGSQTETRYLGDSTVSAATDALSALKSFGNVANFDIAMTSDATLLGMATTLAALPTSRPGSRVHARL